MRIELQGSPTASDVHLPGRTQLIIRFTIRGIDGAGTVAVEYVPDSGANVEIVSGGVGETLSVTQDFRSHTANLTIEQPHGTPLLATLGITLKFGPTHDTAVEPREYYVEAAVI